MSDKMRCDVMALLAGAAVASVLAAAHAQEPATTGATSPHIDIARVKPVDRMSPGLRLSDDIARVMPVDRMSPGLRLSDDRVDLMQNFSLSSRQGVGGAWQTPVVAPDAFDERYGHW
jgi:hypothetical protein